MVPDGQMQPYVHSSATLCKSVHVAAWADDVGRRETMEDSFVLVDGFDNRPTSLFVGVYDGHGGREVVEFVAAELHLCLLRMLRALPPVQAHDGQAIVDCITQAFTQTDNDILRAGICQSGATSCVCLLHEVLPGSGVRTIFTAHLGDARAVICRSGLAVRLTSMSDHKATDPVEMKRVMEQGGTVFNERVNGMLAISRAFGDHQLKMPALTNDVVSNVPDITSTELTDADMFFILACDGLWDVLEDQEAVNLVLEGIHEVRSVTASQSKEIDNRSMAEVLTRMLVEEALARGTSDNCTCVVVFL
jgi:serine/threonine protein phosphatase PrpC